MTRYAVAATLAAALMMACANDWRPLAAPVDGNPCGNAGVVCYAVQSSGAIAPTGMCCPQGFVCGGGGYINVGCPASSCCYEGLDGVSRDGGGSGMPPAAPNRQQRRAAQ